MICCPAQSTPNPLPGAELALARWPTGKIRSTWLKMTYNLQWVLHPHACLAAISSTEQSDGNTAMLPKRGMPPVHTHSQLCCMLQLDKASASFIRWQNASKGGAERRRLQPEIEDESKSIAWQVPCTSFSATGIFPHESLEYSTVMHTIVCLCLTAAALQVDEMEKAVDVAEKNMTRFGLTTQEIRSRRTWVHDTRKTVRLLRKAARRLFAKTYGTSHAVVWSSCSSELICADVC